MRNKTNLIYGIALALVIIFSYSSIVSAQDFVFENETEDELIRIHSDNGNLSVTGDISADEGFFSILGSIANRITSLFVQDIDVSGDVDVAGNVSASWFNGLFNWTSVSSFLTFDGANLDFDDSAFNSTYDNRYHVTGNELSDNLNWSFLQNYPAGCQSGEAIQVINDTLTCVNISAQGSDTLDGYDSSFFMPLNKSVYGDFDFNGGWNSGGFSIIGGDIYAQTGFFYDISSLQVTNLQVNGSLIPDIHNSFDLGNSSRAWKSLYLSEDAIVGGNIFQSGNLVLDNSTNFGGDVSGIYNAIQIGSNVIGDSEINYTQVTLADFTNDAQYVTQTYGNTTYYLASNPDGFIDWSQATNGTLYLSSNPQGFINWGHATNGTLIPYSDEANLNVNSSNYWDGLDSVSDINAGDIADDGTYLLATGDTATGDYNFDSNTFFIDSSNNRVGIGTNSPSQSLSLEDGQIYLGQSSSNQFESGRIRFTEFPGTSHQGAYLHYDGSSNVFNIGVHNINDGATGNDTNVISIERSTGDVGIGTTSPSHLLDIKGSDAIIGLQDTDAGGETWRIHAGASGFSIYDSTKSFGSAFFINDGSANNIGLGTTSPQAKIHVNGSAVFNGTINTDGNRIVNIANATSAQDAVTLSQLQVVNASATAAETDPFWTGNSTLVPYLASANTFTNNNVFNQDLTVDTNTLFVDSSNNRIGIGTTSPVSTLDINSGGNIGVSPLKVRGYMNNTPYYTMLNLDPGSTNGYLQGAITFESDDFNVASIGFQGPDDNGTSGILSFSTRKSGTLTEAARIDGDGDFGIGTTTPGDKLHVEGNIYLGTSSRTIYTGNSGNLNLQTNTGDILFLTANGGTEIMRVDSSSGNVGIGTGSPGTKLDIRYASPSQSADNLTSADLRDLGLYITDTSIDNNDGEITTGIGFGYSTEASTAIISVDEGSNGAAGLGFVTGTTAAPSERVRIDSSGNVGIGTDNPSAKLDISAGTNLNLGVRQLTHGSFSNEGIGMTFSRTSSDSDLSAIGIVDTDKLSLFSRSGIIFGTGGGVGYSETSEVARIDGDGDFGIGISSPATAIHVNDSNVEVRVADASTTGNPKVSLYQTTSERFFIQYNHTVGGIIDSDASLRFRTNNADVLTIDTSGNVGIGSMSPDEKLDISGNIHIPEDQYIFMGDGTNPTFISMNGQTSSGGVEGGYGIWSTWNAYWNGTDWLQERTSLNRSTKAGPNYYDGFAIDIGVAPGASNVIDWTRAFLVDNSGNVGIGTESPSTLLSLSQTSGPSLSFNEPTASVSNNLFHLGNISFSGSDQSSNAAGHYASIESYIVDTNSLIQGSADEGGRLDFNIWRHDVSTQPRVKYTAMTIDNNARIGINTTTPQNTLNVIGDGNFTGSLYSNGAQVLTSFSETDPFWSGNSTLVPYLASANTFTNNNVFNQDLTVDTNTLFVDSSNNRVGIGTTSPGSKLQITETIGDGVVDRSAGIKFSPGSGTDGTGMAPWNPNSAGSSSYRSLTFYSTGWNGTNVVSRDVLTISGGSSDTFNVGIGTTNPQNKLNVIGDGNFTGNVTSQTDFCIEGGNCLSSLSGGGGLSWAEVTNGTLYLSSNPFSFVNTTTASDLNNLITLSGANITDDGTYLLATGDTATGNYTFDTSTLFIDSSGNEVGIGTASPSALLDVAGAAEINGNLDMQGNDIIDIHEISAQADSVMPNIVLDSSSSGDDWTSQGAYISLGESGDLGSASTHLTYRGDGYGFVGAGTVTNAEPAGGFWRFHYNSANVYTDGAVQIANTANPALTVGDGSTGYVTIGSSGWYDDGTYFSPSGSRAFYIRSTTGTTYLYSDNTYLGSTSGDVIHLRSNVFDGDAFYLDGATGGIRLGSASSPGTWELYVQGQAYVNDYLRADGGIHVGGSSDPGTDNLIVDGKLTVSTIDPPYTINGVPYATYTAGMVGLKEEVTGTVSLQTYSAENEVYMHVIDFNSLEKGSDLWLFGETINIHGKIYVDPKTGKERSSSTNEIFEDIAVILSSNFNGNVWYKKVPEEKKLIIYGNQEGEVSYRLTGTRFDGVGIGNIRTADIDEDGEELEIVEGLNLDKLLKKP